MTKTRKPKRPMGSSGKEVAGSRSGRHQDRLLNNKPKPTEPKAGNPSATGTRKRKTCSCTCHTGKRLYRDEKWLALRWSVSEKKLQADRAKGVGPKFVKFGDAVRYRLRVIYAYERDAEQSNTCR